MFGAVERLAEDSKKIDRSDKELEARIVEGLEREGSFLLEISSEVYKSVTGEEDDNYRRILERVPNLKWIKTMRDDKSVSFVSTFDLYNSLQEETGHDEEAILERYFLVRTENEEGARIRVYDFHKYNWKVVIQNEKDKSYRLFGDLKIDITKFMERGEEAKNGE